MIDTIVITLSRDLFEITDPELFIPSAAWALSKKIERGMQSKQNPLKKELTKGIYKPRLTLAYRYNLLGKPEIILKIELSLPKLVFGNNFSELRYKDFPSIINKLVATLQAMGICTTSTAIASAPVSAIHYSKNMCLTDGSTPHFYINKIKEANTKLSLDVNETAYRNAGHSFKWLTNYYEVAFYDKIRDLEKAQTSNKRAVEKDNELQLTTHEQLQKRRTKFEVLRMEVRLNKRVKIKELFTKLGIKTDVTFKKMFKPAISKKVLLHYFDELVSKRPLLLDYQSTNGKALLVDLMFNNPNLGPKQLLQLYGFKKVLEIMDMRELRTMFSRCSPRSWQRLIADVSKIQLSRALDHFKALREQLVKFEPINKQYKKFIKR
ncbi:MAG: hypothetical protein ACOYT8_04925 [Candidatus Dependentiae bacterium]